MAIITDSIVDVGSYTTFNIGLSKLIGNYTADEIWNFPYCSSQWRFWQHIGDTTYNDFAPGGAGEPYNLQFPLKFTGRYESDGALNFDPGEIEYNNPGGIYCRIIWLYGTTTPITTLFPNNKRSITSGDNVKIITQMDMTKCRIHAKDVVPGDYVHPIGPVNQTNYINFDEFKIIENHDNVTDYMPPSHGVIFPAVMFQWNGKLHIFRLFQNSYNALDWSWFVSTNTEDKNVQGYEWDAQSLSFDGQQGVYFPINIYRQFQHLYPLSAESHESWTVDFEGNVGAIYQWWYGSHTGGRINPATEETYLEAISWYGMMFEHKGIQYKPIIEDGYVTGYTDDMTVPSDIDNWVGDTNHNVPPYPPGHDTTDDIDDHVMGSGTGISGMANLWLLTRSQLNDLHGAFNNAPGGFDPMNSLISVMGLGVSPTYLFDDIEFITPINIRKSDGTSWSTGVEGHIVSAQKSAFQFTGIKIDRLYNNFLDYSPYAIHEIFIPMCGWLTLPDIAVDRKITVTYLPDIESLKCRAVVSVVDNSGNRCVIGEKDGIMGADVPFTNTGHSLYVGEAIINGMNIAGEVITGAIGAGFTKKNAKGGTFRPYEGFTVGMGGTLPGAIGNAIVSGQTNRTHYMTGNGTRIGFSDGENIQIKSTYHNIDRPANYAHTVGLVCNMTGTLDKFSGFTVCDNPHITFSALEAEKSEIKALLEEGVIL